MKNEINSNQLFNLNPLSSWIYDLKTLEILEVNEKAIEHYGYTKDEFLTLTLLDLRPTSEIEKLLESRKKNKKAKGNNYIGIFTHQKKDSTQIKMEINGHKLVYKDRECMLVVCLDVTLKIEYEKRLFESEQRFKALVQEGSDMISILDLNGEYSYTSPTMTLILGFEPKEFLGKTILELIHPEDFEIVENCLNRIRTENKLIVEPFRLRNANNEWRWIETVLTNLIDNPSIKGIVANSRDITEQVDIELEKKKNEQFNRTIMESSPDCLKIIDNQGRLQFMNENGRNQMEIDDFSVFKNKFWHSLWGIENEALIKKSLHSAAKGSTFHFTAKCPTAKGKLKWWDVVVSPIGKPDEPFEKFIAVSRDITKQKKEEHQLKLISSVITHTKDAVLITEAEPMDQPGPRIIYVNDAFTTMTGYSLKEVIGKTPRILQGPNSDKTELSRLSKAMRNWETYEITTINYKKNGDEFWVNFTVTPVADETGWYTHWIAIERDVTQQKQKEIEKELLAKISKNFSFENDLYSASQSLCETIGQFGNFDLVELWLPNIQNTQIQLFTYLSNSEVSHDFYHSTNRIKSFEFGKGLPGKVWEKKTTLIWDDIGTHTDFIRSEAAQRAQIGSAMGVPLIFNQKLIAVLFVGSKFELNHIKKYQVILEQLQKIIGSEINRKKLENDLLYLHDAIPDIICSLDSNGCILTMNQSGCDLIGYKETEIVLEPLLKFIHPDDHKQTKLYLQKQTRNEKFKNFENRLISKNNEIVWLSWTTSSNLKEKVKYATARNITEEKRLRELNRQTRQLAKVGGWEYDLIKDHLFWSEEVHLLHETDPTTFVPNVTSAILFYREDHKLKVSQLIEKSINEGVNLDYEAVIITTRNEEKWIRVIGNPEYIAGKCVKFVGSFQDITDRKLAEIAVLQSEANFKTIFEIATLGIAQVDPENGKILLANSYYETITGYTVEELMKMSFVNLTHPEDQKQDWKLFSSAASGKSEYRNEKRYIKKDGSIVWVRLHVAFIRDNNGAPIKTVAICEDISDRKKSEERIRVSEERRRLIMSGALDAIICIDVNETITFWNHRSEGIFGWKEKDVLGLKLSELIVPEAYRKFHVQGLKHYLATGEGKALNKLLELSAIKSSGEEFPIELTVIPIEQKDEIFFCAFIRDITERKKSEKTILEANERFEKVTEATNDAIWDYDATNDDLFWGKGFTTLFGYNLDEIKPSFNLLISLIHDEDRPIVKNKVERYMLDPSLNNWNEEYRFKRNDGTYAFVIDRATFLRNNNGEVVRVIGAMTDISERKSFESQLINLNESLKNYADELEQSNEELEQFAFIASHDLQEPLRMVTSFMDLLKRKYGFQLDEKAHDYIHFATDGAKRMSQIISDLLDYSRAGRSTLSKEKVDLNQLLDDFRLLRTKIISEKNVTLTYKNLPTILSSKVSIIQILHALLDNAIKYSRKDVQPKIEIKVTEKNSNWLFEIKDNGIGIPQKFHEQIFIIFQRLHNREDYGGSGIGLSIAKKHVLNLGGKIWLDSKSENGTTFYFTIAK